MWNINEEEKPCSHSSVAYTEVVKHTLVKTHHPISNSRIQSINDFEIAKTKETKVPAYKCLDCGEIIETRSKVDQFSKTNEFDYGYSQRASTGTTYGLYGQQSIALGRNSVALGYTSCATTGQYNIAIGAGAGMKYAGDYSPTNYTTRSITDKEINMGFLDDMSEALENAENRQEKAMKNYENKQFKLDRIAEKVRALRRNMLTGENSLTSEIDKIKAEYDQIVNRQEATQKQAQQQFRSSSKLNSPPPPPPFPQKRKEGMPYDAGSDRGYQYTNKVVVQPNKENDPNIDGIEYMKIMFRGLDVEEKTYNDIKYVDFIFYKPVDQEDSKLNLVEKGDVLEWIKVPKNK
ncbi:unnamed protein product, partial [marine sediment metagenome]